MKHLIPAFLAFLTLQAGAQNVKLNSGGDWKVPVKDGVLELKGRMRKITSEQLQKVDPAARYTLTWEARGSVPEEAGKYMIGFSVYDKDGLYPRIGNRIDGGCAERRQNLEDQGRFKMEKRCDVLSGISCESGRRRHSEP